MTDLPEPLTPADCDLRDFPFMQVDIRRLLTSETWVLGTAEEKVAAFTLWCEAWHQLPAASIPDNARMLAHLSQAGAKWAKVREHVLKSWVKCSDDRLYHPVVAEKAREAWTSKKGRKEKDTSEADRKRRERDDRKSLFAALREHGIVPHYQTSTSELRSMAADLSRRPAQEDHTDGHETGTVTQEAGHADESVTCHAENVTSPPDVRDMSWLREGEGEREGYNTSLRSVSPSIPQTGHAVAKPLQPELLNGELLPPVSLRRSAKPEPGGFPEWYAAFPKHVARDDAAKSYAQVVSTGRATPDELLAGAQRYAQERHGEDAKFTKLPATWLNRGCWKDEPAPRQVKTGMASVVAGLTDWMEGR